MHKAAHHGSQWRRSLWVFGPVLAVTLLACALGSWEAHADELDPYASFDADFETPWLGEMRYEQWVMRATGELIADFVKENAKRHRQWEEEYRQLRAEVASWSSLRRGAIMRAAAATGSIYDLFIVNPVDISLPLMPGLVRDFGKYQRFKAYEMAFARSAQIAPGRWAFRAVHRKSHGCYRAKIQMAGDLDPGLQAGLFKPNASYDAIVRFSNGNPHLIHDLLPDSHGMAVKWLPSGTLREGLADADAQAITSKTLLNISNVDMPIAFMFDPDEYLEVNRAFLAVLKTPLDSFSAPLGQAQAFLAMKKRPRILGLAVNSRILFSPLFNIYWSESAYRLGGAVSERKTAYKTIMQPCLESEADQRDANEAMAPWTEKRYVNVGGVSGLTSIPLVTRRKLKNDPDYKRNHSVERLKRGSFCFALYAQRFIDKANTPIEDPTEIWLESEEQRQAWMTDFGELPANKNLHAIAPLATRKVAPPMRIGTIELAKLSAAELAEVDPESPSYAKRESFCEFLNFSVWEHSPEEHKPLGISNRMRSFAYGGSVKARRGRSGENE